MQQSFLVIRRTAGKKTRAKAKRMLPCVTLMGHCRNMAIASGYSLTRLGSRESNRVIVSIHLVTVGDPGGPASPDQISTEKYMSECFLKTNNVNPSRLRNSIGVFGVS